MKLVIQIPCFNEADQLPQTLAELPKNLSGFDEVIVLVVDDGSTDGTSLVAREQGVEWLIRHRCNRGLAAAFSSGIEAALQLGADIIVNTDADGQYFGTDIAKLVEPILSGRFDIVIGDRQPCGNSAFSWHKRVLQRAGSRIISCLIDEKIPDAVSGFRAFSREAALRMSVLTDFSYTIETLFQAKQCGLSITSTPIKTRPVDRQSRLSCSVPQFVWRSILTIVSLQVRYHPLTFLLPIAAVLFSVGSMPIFRFIVLFAIGNGNGHVQSLILGGVAIVSGLLVSGLAVLGHLSAVNRELLERQLYLQRKSQTTVPRSTTTGRFGYEVVF